MSLAYSEIEGKVLRMKWAEQQERTSLNETNDGVVSIPVFKRVVLIADFGEKIAELRLNPPENRHAYTDNSGRPTGEAYYNAYIQKAKDMIGSPIVPLDLRHVIKSLVEEQEPRVARIHIDNHTDQQNYRSKTTGPNADVRDSPDWSLIYQASGNKWSWDGQSFYWLPKASSGFLTREVFTHIDADEGFVKVNADCSDEEVGYVISQIRAR